MTEMATIQIWNSFEPKEIKPEATENKFSVEVRTPKGKVPAELEKTVNQRWAENCAKNPKAKDNPILYLAEPITIDQETVRAVTEERGFKYTYLFNRNPDFHSRTGELSDHKLLSISTHCHLITKDGKITFGTKKNQFNQISGFAGFPNLKEDAVEVEGKKHLNTASNYEEPAKA